MYKKTYEFTVGLFILLGIIALIFMALKVSGLSIASFSHDHYRIKAQFSDIGSLRTGAAVRISGVEIGSVKSIELESSYNGFIATVDMNINSKYNQIPREYSAAIETSGILGDSFIALQPAKISLPDLYQEKYLQNGSIIELANTSSAINLNSLINTFVSSDTNSKSK